MLKCFTPRVKRMLCFGMLHMISNFCKLRFPTFAQGIITSNLVAKGKEHGSKTSNREASFNSVVDRAVGLVTKQRCPYRRDVKIMSMLRRVNVRAEVVGFWAWIPHLAQGWRSNYWIRLLACGGIAYWHVPARISNAFWSFMKNGKLWIENQLIVGW